jgi:hypothetical protein
MTTVDTLAPGTSLGEVGNFILTRTGRFWKVCIMILAPHGWTVSARYQSVNASRVIIMEMRSCGWKEPRARQTCPASWWGESALSGANPWVRHVRAGQAPPTTHTNGPLSSERVDKKPESVYRDANSLGNTPEVSIKFTVAIIQPRCQEMQKTAPRLSTDSSQR